MKEMNESTTGQTKKSLPDLTPEALELFLLKKNCEVRYNAITKQVEISGMEQEDPEQLPAILVALLYAQLHSRFAHCTMQTIGSYLDILASRNNRNPVFTIILAAGYDEGDHLSKLYDILGLSEDDTLSRLLLKKWLYQTVALQFNSLKTPFGADGVLVLTGPQGIGKTSFFRKLAVQPELFKEGVRIDVRDKDTCLQATSCWICELGEIETTFRADAEHLKAFITQAVDEYRMPYARKSAKMLRRTSFCGTCNSSDFLTDTTGNRRFWTIPVTHIDLDALAKFDAAQLWRQISLEVTDQENGGLQCFRLTPDEQRQLAARNANHEKKLPAQEELEDIFAESDTPYYKIVWEYQTVTAFKEDHDVLKKYSTAQIGKALDHMGIVLERRRVNGKICRFRNLPKRQYLPSSTRQL